jgi:hypothetical protein
VVRLENIGFCWFRRIWQLEWAVMAFFLMILQFKINLHHQKNFVKISKKNGVMQKPATHRKNDFTVLSFFYAFLPHKFKSSLNFGGESPWF